MGASHSRSAREHERDPQRARAPGRRTRNDGDHGEQPNEASPSDDGPAARRRRLSLGSTLRLRRPSTQQPPTPSAPPHPEQQGPDPLAHERREASRLIERVLGHPPPPPHASHQRLDPERLRGTYRPPPRLGGGSPRPSTLGTLLSEVLGATARANPQRQEPQSGTSVIVQGALVARTAQHRGESTGPQPDGTPQAATLQEQGEMLGSILRVATAATAASLVSMPSGPQPDAPAPQAAPAPPRASSAPPGGDEAPTEAPSAPSAVPESQRRGADLLNRLNNLSDHLRAGPQPREQESMTMISRLMREALRNVLPGANGERAQEAPPTPQAPAGSTAQSVLHVLDNARQGRPLSDGESGSFERFLHDLIVDLCIAVQRIRQNGETDDDEGLRERRSGDISAGELSFFRLFRFERTQEDLVPCVLVGVRSLRAGERLMGDDEHPAQGGAPGGHAAPQEGHAPPQEGHAPSQEGHAFPQEGHAPSQEGHAQAGAAGGAQPQSTSRFILFVSGGRYHDEHPLLTAHPRNAGRDLMFMMELLGTMASMSAKAPTASAADIARSGLRKVRAAEVASLVAAGEITENAREQCLVCLDEWQPEDEVRILSCHHAFHAGCVDRWLEQSSNTCPLCAYLLTRPIRGCTSGRWQCICRVKFICVT